MFVTCEDRKIYALRDSDLLHAPTIRSRSMRVRVPRHPASGVQGTNSARTLAQPFSSFSMRCAGSSSSTLPDAGISTSPSSTEPGDERYPARGQSKSFERYRESLGKVEVVSIHAASIYTPNG